MPRIESAINFRHETELDPNNLSRSFRPADLVMVNAHCNMALLHIDWLSAINGGCVCRFGDGGSGRTEYCSTLNAYYAVPLFEVAREPRIIGALQPLKAGPVPCGNRR